MPNNGLRPRPHQVDALADLVRAFATSDRAQLVMACGAGKTLTARWHAEGSHAQRTLVLVPSLALVAQTLAEWRQGGLWRFEALVVCSDPSTAEGEAERAEDADDTDLRVDAPFWAAKRARVTTDHRDVIDFLRSHKPGRPQVIFSTYHSTPVVAHAQAATRASFDLLVADEAHRLAGHPREEFRAALDARQLLADRRLFMTATPLTFDTDNPAALPDLLSMDDAATFGPVAHTVSFADAISAGLLCDYQVLAIAGRRGHQRADRLETVPAALVDAVAEHGITRVLTYHGRVSGAVAFAAAVDGYTLPDGRTIRARAVHSNQRTKSRTDTLAWLGQNGTDEVRVVSSARCLNEGVNVPAVDAAMFADPRGSTVDIIQAVGRVLRAAPGKTIGSVIIPVALPAGDDDDTALAVSAFGPVWTVVRALRAHDERLAVDLDRAANTLGEPGPDRPWSASDKISFVLPDGASPDQLHVRLVQETSQPWEGYFGLLAQYARDTGGSLIPNSYAVGTVRLGAWVQRQRLAHRLGRLPAERAARLEQVPGWVWSRDDAIWDRSFQTLRALADRAGSVEENASEPSIFEGLLDAERRPLRRWVARQRQAQRDGDLSEEQVRRLRAVPGWTWHPLPPIDLRMVDALREYGAWEKHVDVPADYVDEDGLKLGRWVLAVRRRKLTGSLHPALADEIAVGCPRDTKGESLFAYNQTETQWRLAYAALRTFARREGHAHVPTVHVEQLDDAAVGLGQWVALQRHRAKRGELPDRQRQALEGLPGWRWSGAAVVEYGEPLDLGGHPHGTAKGVRAGCRCEPCSDASTRTDREFLDRRRQVAGGVPTGPVIAHLAALTDQLAEAARAVRWERPPGLAAVAVAADVPLGTLKTIVSGTLRTMSAAHADAILAVTAPAVMAQFDLRDERGRPVMSAHRKVDVGPTSQRLKDLHALGWPQTWVATELGYSRKIVLGRTHVTARVADAVAALHERIGGRSAPPVKACRTLPRLADLEESGAIAPVAARDTGRQAEAS